MKQDIYHFIGRILKGRYRLEEFVDEGGMSVVYRALDLQTQSVVAVKILAPRFLTRPEQAEKYLELFKREAFVTEKLNHPNIVTIYDSGVESGMAFIVMEWLEGHTLGEELINSGEIPLTRAASILYQVCAALDAAHRLKTIHLDLKPNNIFLLENAAGDVQVKVIDFGLGRIMQSTLGTTLSRVVGTPQYMAPEIFTNKASKMSDIYSLGVVTFELLTGVVPFSTSHIFALVRQHIDQVPPSVRNIRRDVPELIDDLIRRAMHKSPASRPKSAREFYEEFARALRSSNIPAEKPFKPVVYVSGPTFLWRHRKMIAWIFGTIYFAFLVSITIYMISPIPNLIGVNLTRFRALLIYLLTSVAFFTFIDHVYNPQFLLYDKIEQAFIITILLPIGLVLGIATAPIILVVYLTGGLFSTFVNVLYKKGKQRE
jgi:serine/threonine protein kinase